MTRRAAPAGEPTRTRRGGRFRLRVRLRLSVVAALAFAAVVLATSMPVEALLTQHRQLDAATAALSQARAADRSLSAQVKALSDPATVDDLARSDYGLVAPGHKAYVILPPEGASASAVTGSGHVPLDQPPVVPGSALSGQLLGLGPPSSAAGGDPATSSPSSSSAGDREASSRRAPQEQSGGFWARVVQTMEFWR